MAYRRGRREACHGLPSGSFTPNAMDYGEFAPWMTLPALRCPPTSLYLLCEFCSLFVLFSRDTGVISDTRQLLPNSLLFLNMPPYTLLLPIKIWLSPQCLGVAQIRSNHFLPWVSTCILFWLSQFHFCCFFCCYSVMQRTCAVVCVRNCALAFYCLLM